MAKGFPRAEAERVAARIFENPEHALDTLVREELGLDPDELGSRRAPRRLVPRVRDRRRDPGPAVPVRRRHGGVRREPRPEPRLAVRRRRGVSLLTGRSMLFSGARQLAIGAGAAAVTYAVGTLIGVGGG